MNEFLSYYLLLKLKIKMSLLNKEEKFIVGSLVDNIWAEQDIDSFSIDSDINVARMEINNNKYYIDEKGISVNGGLILDKKNIAKNLFAFAKNRYLNNKKKQERRKAFTKGDYNKLLQETEGFFSKLTYHDSKKNKQDQFLKMWFDILRKEKDQLHENIFKAMMYSETVECWGNVIQGMEVAIKKGPRESFSITCHERKYGPYDRKNEYLIGYYLKINDNEVNCSFRAGYKEIRFMVLLRKMIKIRNKRTKKEELLKNQRAFLENNPEYSKDQINKALDQSKIKAKATKI